MEPLLPAAGQRTAHIGFALWPNRSFPLFLHMLKAFICLPPVTNRGLRKIKPSLPPMQSAGYASVNLPSLRWIGTRRSTSLLGRRVVVVSYVLMCCWLIEKPHGMLWPSAGRIGMFGASAPGACTECSSGYHTTMSCMSPVIGGGGISLTANGSDHAARA